MGQEGASGASLSLCAKSLCSFLNETEHPPRRDSPGSRPMKDGLAAAQRGTKAAVKRGQRGEDTICGRAPLASHASSAFHATHSSPLCLPPPRTLISQHTHTPRIIQEENEGYAGGPAPRRPPRHYASLPAVSLSRLQSAGIKRVFKYQKSVSFFFIRMI